MMDVDEEMSLDVTSGISDEVDMETDKLFGILRSDCEEALGSLKECWKLMGIEKENLSHRVLTVRRLVSETYSKMIKEEETHKNNLIKSIDKHLKEQYKLCKELGVERPAEPDHRDSLIKVEKTLRDVNKELNEEKSRRMKIVLKYKKEDGVLAGELDEEAFYISAHCIPSEEQIKAVIDHIQLLKSTKKQRLAELSESKLYALELMDALETEPENEFARSFICEDEENFHLSAENLAAVRAYVNKLQKALDDNKEYAQSLREKINSLYSRLELDDFERMEFLEKHTGHKPSTIDKLKDKLDDLEALKRVNMRKFILATRAVLEKWWQKCFYHKAQCDLFAPYYSDEDTEEILKAHENEVEKIKSYYEKNSQLFELFEKRQELWRQMLDLKQKLNSNDPNRFKGRQTNFLEEEKIRKRVNKVLPKVEEKLTVAIGEYEEENGEPFCVGGIPVQEYLDRQSMELKEEEERDKKNKADQRKKLLIHETMYGSRPLTPAKGGNTTKRKEIGTPMGLSSSKRLRPSASTTSLAKSKSSSMAKSTTSTKSLPTVTTQQSSNKVKRNLLGTSETIVSGNELKPSASVSSLSTTRTDFDPFVRSQYNFVNSTMQEARAYFFGSSLTSTQTTDTTSTSNISKTFKSRKNSRFKLR